MQRPELILAPDAIDTKLASAFPRGRKQSFQAAAQLRIGRGFQQHPVIVVGVAGAVLPEIRLSVGLVRVV